MKPPRCECGRLRIEHTSAQRAECRGRFAGRSQRATPPEAVPTQPLALSLFDEPHAYVRHGAHPTEAAAAAKALGRSGTQRVQILQAIAARGELGATDDEVALVVNMFPPRVATRRLELQEGGWVFNTGITRKTRTDSEAIVWRATPAALIELARRTEADGTGR